MEESVGYNEENERAKTSSQWNVEATSTLSFNERPPKLSIQQQNLELQILQEKEFSSGRKVIPSTMHERLSYYRTFTSSTTKTQIICMQHVQFNRFLWYYITNVIFKSLPHTFVQIFLSSYAPEEHLFLSKMVPLFQGTKGMLIMAGFLELIGYIDTGVLLFDYVVCGVLFKSPWNRCKTPSYLFKQMNKTIHCYDLKDFAKKFANGTSKFESLWYVDANNETFQAAEIEYYRDRKKIWDTYICYVYFGILWLSAGIAHTMVYRKSFWKVLNTLQWMINSVDILFFIHLALSYFHDRFTDRIILELPSYDELGTLWKADIDMLADSTTAPPILHVLTARSTQEINPGRDSTVIIASNAICFIFRGLLTYRVKIYVENFIGAPLYLTDLSQHSWFYFFPMYLSTFYLGELYCLMFLGLNLCMEVMSITVTYHSLIEVIVCEWNWAKRYLVTMFLTVVGFVIYTLTTLNARIFLYICSKVIAALTEMLIIYCAYPLGRLLDDFTFHYGEPPTKLRVFSLRMVPIFYTIKCYTMMDGLLEVMIQSGFMSSIDNYKWLWSLMFVPVLLGIVYTIYIYLYKQKKSWKLMFRPDVNWGPRDLATRQLRKQFDSRVYIGSQAPRALSRYLIDKAEPDAYRLDLHYSTGQRSALFKVPSSKFDKEKKQV